MAAIIGVHGDHACEGQGGECGLHLAFPEVTLERVQDGFEIGGFGADLFVIRVAPEEITDAPVEVFLKGREGVKGRVGDFNRLRLYRLPSWAWADACEG